MTVARLDGAAAGRIPAVVNIKKDSHELAAGIGMDLAVCRPALAAHRHHGRVLGQRKPEFFAQDRAHVVALDRLGQPREGWAATQGGERIAAGADIAGEVRFDLRQRVGGNKLRHDKVVERIAFDRCVAEGL